MEDIIFVDWILFRRAERLNAKTSGWNRLVHEDTHTYRRQELVACSCTCVHLSCVQTPRRIVAGNNIDQTSIACMQKGSSQKGRPSEENLNLEHYVPAHAKGFSTRHP
jgi:hypothetical protein